MPAIKNMLNEEGKAHLIMKVTNEDILVALCFMDFDKAPKLDGFSPCLYRAMKKFLDCGQIPHAWKATFIMLIPKYD